MANKRKSRSNRDRPQLFAIPHKEMLSNDQGFCVLKAPSRVSGGIRLHRTPIRHGRLTERVGRVERRLEIQDTEGSSVAGS